MYSPFRPFTALLTGAANAGGDFIVRGAPARSTPPPCGTPPARTGPSRPPTWVSSSSPAAHLLHDPVEEGPELPPALLEVRPPLRDVERGPEGRDRGLRGLREAGDVLWLEVRGGLPQLLQLRLEDVAPRGAEDLREHGPHPLPEPRPVRMLGHDAEDFVDLPPLPVVGRADDERLHGPAPGLGGPRRRGGLEQGLPREPVELQGHAVQGLPPPLHDGLVPGRAGELPQGGPEELQDRGEVLVRELLRPPVRAGRERPEELAGAAPEARAEDRLELRCGVREPDGGDPREGEEVPPFRLGEQGKGGDDCRGGARRGPLEGEEDVLRRREAREGRKVREVPQVHEAAGMAGEELGRGGEDDGGGPPGGRKPSDRPTPRF